jgi:hypothetical protein
VTRGRRLALPKAGCAALLALIAAMASYPYTHRYIALPGQPGWAAAVTHRSQRIGRKDSNWYKRPAQRAMPIPRQARVSTFGHPALAEVRRDQRASPGLGRGGERFALT